MFQLEISLVAAPNRRAVECGGGPGFLAPGVPGSYDGRQISHCAWRSPQWEQTEFSRMRPGRTCSAFPSAFAQSSRRLAREIALHGLSEAFLLWQDQAYT